MTPLDFGRLFSLFHWFQLRPGPPSDLYLVLLGMYAVGLGASAAYFFNVRQHFSEHAYRMAVARRVALVAGTVCGGGLLFVGLRYWGIPYLSVRAWVYIISIAALALGVFLAYFFWRRYPASLRAYDERMLRLRYIPRPKPRGTSGARRRKRGR